MLTEAQAYFKAWNVPVMSWWLEPHLQPSDWEMHLGRCGLRYDRGTPGMAADLRGLPEEGMAVADLQVLAVQDAPALRTWAHTMVAGFGLPPAWESGLLALVDGLGFDPPTRHYLGSLHGQPVAIAALFLAAGVAGLQYLATVPDARGRGIARAMAVTALREARTLGYRAAILQSSEMGYNPFGLQLGFRTLSHIGYSYWAR